MHVTVFTKPGCHLCDDALHLIDGMTRRYDIQLTEVNILDDMAVYEEYRTLIPVVQVTDVRVGRLVAPIIEPELHSYFTMARQVIAGNRIGGGGSGGSGNSVLPPQRESVFDRIASYVGRHWLRLTCIVLAIFVGLPWLAPVFAAMGWWGLADPIYTAYTLSCHQLPERAGQVFGYQVAFCYRNTALYGGLLLFGIIYGLARDGKLRSFSWLTKPLPWWGFVLFLLPMAMDGFTHMFGLRENFDWTMDSSFGSFYIGSQPWSLNWWLRIITGLTAALGAVWFAFPRMQHAVDEAERLRDLYKQAAAISYQPTEPLPNIPNTGQA
jgi:uncharacterized membrane protein/glutaredoxin